jgi:hypothetical protein
VEVTSACLLPGRRAETFVRFVFILMWEEVRKVVGQFRFSARLTLKVARFLKLYTDMISLDQEHVTFKGILANKKSYMGSCERG